MSRTKILLVDDDNLLRHVFRKALEQSEFDVIKASHYEQAIGLATDITKSRQIEKALQQQVHKLERFNTMSVGRELRMIELKKEINALLNELRREAKYTIHSIPDDNSEAAS